MRKLRPQLQLEYDQTAVGHCIVGQTANRLLYFLKPLKKRLLHQEGFKSITELSNQGIETSFSEIWDIIN